MEKNQLSQEQWAEIKDLFITAVEQDQHNAMTVIEHLKFQNVGQFQILEKMIRIHFDPKNKTIAPHLDVREKVFKCQVLYPGDLIGKYQIVRSIGHGGMGDVYLASRQDVVDQWVAIKLFKTDLNERNRQRFENERRILAKLEHPNIARFIDAGSHNGAPYFVMEYVNGMPIDQFANHKRLNLKKRLALFLQICEAISYAHNKLVIHRDLKPTNILVNNDGQVKLLDFGIAKLLNQSMDASVLHQTIAGTGFYTPQFAAPEQFSGIDVGVSSDVFVLGLLLYKLVTNEYAFDLKHKSLAQIELILANQIQTLPSEVVKKNKTKLSQFGYKVPGTLYKKLKGDLDEIICHALKKEPDKRYQSVTQFKQDINNYLVARPISIKINYRIYRYIKFVKRTYLTLLAVATMVVMGVTFIVSTIEKNNDIAEQKLLLIAQRDLAINEQEKATALSDMLMDAFIQANPTQSLDKEFKAINVLDEVARKIDSNERIDPILKVHLKIKLSRIYITMAEFNKSYAVHQSIDIKMLKDLKLFHASQLILAEILMGQHKYEDARFVIKDVYKEIEGNYDESHPIRIHANELKSKCEIDCLIPVHPTDSDQ